MSAASRSAASPAREDVAAAVAAGADLVGFVLVPEPPARVASSAPRELAAACPAASQRSRSSMRTRAGRRALGAEPRSIHGSIWSQTYDTRGAVPRHDRRPPAASRSPACPTACRVLLDLRASARARRARTCAAHWERRAPAPRRPVMLAGSARRPSNVAAAIAAARPWAWTRARGVESAPGRQGSRPDARRSSPPPRRPREHRPTPDGRGRFGDFGGRFVPETVMAALDELDGRLRGGPRRPGLRRRASSARARLRRPPDAALPGRAPGARSPAPASGSSART